MSVRLTKSLCLCWQPVLLTQKRKSSEIPAAKFKALNERLKQAVSQKNLISLRGSTLFVNESSWKTVFINTGIKSYSFLCWAQRIVGQKVSTKSWMAAISSFPLHEYWYYLVLRSNIHVKGDKMKRGNNPIRLPFDSWCSLSVPQCAATYRETESLDDCMNLLEKLHEKQSWNSWSSSITTHKIET